MSTDPALAGRSLKHRSFAIAALNDIAVATVYAACVGVFAQIVIPLPFTPVPITGQTFAVLLGAMLIGARRGVLGMLVYVLAGLAGLPWFAAAHGGPHTIALPSFGYILGFIAAAGLAGHLAERGWSRQPLLAGAALAAGTVVVYIVGASWLAIAIHVSAGQAVALGVLPFLVGDALKIALGAALLPLRRMLKSG